MAWTLPPRTTGKGKIRYTGMFRDATGRQRSAGTFNTDAAALRAAQDAEAAVAAGTWIDPTHGKITFERYVNDRWWNTVHIEVSTAAGYRSYLRTHFVPFFGPRRMKSITAPVVQAWVTKVSEAALLKPVTIVKYHTMLHALFAQAVVDRVIAANPCADTALPKVPSRRAAARHRKIISPAQYEDFIAALPEEWVDLADTGIETGARPGLFALQVRVLDEVASEIRIERTLVEVSKKDSPTGERFIVKEYPKDGDARNQAVSPELIDRLVARASRLELGPTGWLFARPCGSPLSRSDFRQDVWLPAFTAAGLTGVTLKDLRHARASWALAGGASLVQVRDDLGHNSTTTTELYLHALAGAERDGLNAFARVRASGRVPRLTVAVPA